MIKCPNPDCGYENVDGTQFCEGCGEELPHAGAASAANAVGGNTPIHGAATTPPDMIKCPACENLNPADNVVCEVCGTELHPAGAAPTIAPVSSAPASTNVGSGSAMPSTSGDSSSVTPDTSALSGGTATPPASLISANTSTSADPTVTTSTVAPSALAGNSSLTEDSSIADAMMPVVAAGDTTSGISPTGTTLPTGDAALTTPSASSSPVAGAIASADPVSASPAADSAATSSTEMSPGRVKLTVEQGMTIGKQFVLGDPEILVGREDEEEQIYPDIDLSDQDEGYVHRRHAQLKFDGGKLTATHLGGANRTRVNNKPLEDNVPQNVNIGDKISFGKVVMRVGAA